jgi:hypothetical protein
MNTGDLVRSFYEEIWNRGNKAKIPELLHESFIFRGSLGQTKRGHHGFAEYVEFVTDALSESMRNTGNCLRREQSVRKGFVFRGSWKRISRLSGNLQARRVDWRGAVHHRWQQSRRPLGARGS